MRKRFEEILRQTNDDSHSHAQRMISIRKECVAAIAELDEQETAPAPKKKPEVEKDVDAPAEKPAAASHKAEHTVHGAKTGNPVQKPHTSHSGNHSK